MMRKGPILITILLFSGIFLISGCVRKEVREKKVTISYSFWAEAKQLAWREKIVSSFMKLHPNIDVKLQHVAGEYQAKLLTQIAAGTVPDVIEIPADQLTPYASTGTFVDLEPYIKEDKDFNQADYIPQALNALKCKGIQYALPERVLTTVLFYNKNMFDEVNLSYPDENWTWDDLLAAAKKLTKGKGEEKQFGFLGSDDRDLWIYLYGGKIYNEDMTKCIINNRASIRSLQLWADLVNKYHASPTVAETGTQGWESLIFFVPGRAAMNLSSNFMLQFYKEIKKFHWGVAPIPKDPETGKRVTINYVDGNAISTQSKHKKEAWELVKYLSKTIALGGETVIPPVKSFSNPLMPKEYQETFLDALDYGTIKVSTKPFTRHIIKEELDRLWMGEQTAAEACKKIEAKLNEN